MHRPFCVWITLELLPIQQLKCKINRKWHCICSKIHPRLCRLNLTQLKNIGHIIKLCRTQDMILAKHRSIYKLEIWFKQFKRKEGILVFLSCSLMSATTLQEKTVAYVNWITEKQHTYSFCLFYLYFSIILFASSRESSVEVVPPPPFGPSSLFMAMNAKYMSPIVACNQAMYYFSP